jgi:hypothetical protein
LRFEERDLPDVVYIEQLTSDVYLDPRTDVEHYLKVADTSIAHHARMYDNLLGGCFP